MSFEHFVFANEPAIRFVSFFGVLAVIGLWELASTRHAAVAIQGRGHGLRHQPAQFSG